MKTRLLGICLLGLLLSPGGLLRADGVIRDSVGPIPGGRGGANIGYADNGAVLLSNPAGMTNLRGNGWFEIGVDGLVTDLEHADQQSSSDNEAWAFGIPMLSVMQKSDDERWAAGIGVFVPAGFGAQWDLNAPPFFGDSATYKSVGGLIKIIPGVAYQVTDRLSVGATLGVAVSHAELEGPFVLQTGPLAGVPTRLDLQATGAAPTWSVGTQYKLTDRTVIGAVYTSEDRFRMEGSARADVFGLAPVPVPSSFDAEVDLVWPQSVGVGVQHQINDRHRVGVDVIWFDWSHAFDQLDLKLSNPTNPMFRMLGPRIQDSFPLDWEDSITVRTGYEYHWTRQDILRTGYVFNSDTVPNATLTPYIPAILDHTVSAGYSRIWRDYWFNVAYNYAWGSDRHVGDSAIVGGDFDNTYFKSQAHWLYFSIARQW